MNIQIRPLTQNGEPRWCVSFAKNRVSFRSEMEARTFVTTLEARLRAPHVLPSAIPQRHAG